MMMMVVLVYNRAYLLQWQGL